MKIKFPILLLTALYCLPVFAAGSVKLNVSLNPAGSFAAESKDVQGVATQRGAEYFAKNVVLNLDSLKTGISLRDNHMKEKYFETKKFPKATLTQAHAKDGKFDGELMIRNKTKKISGTYSVSGSDLSAKFNCGLSDFDIPSAKYMGVGVEDEVAVEVHLPVSKGP